MGKYKFVQNVMTRVDGGMLDVKRDGPASIKYKMQCRDSSKEYVYSDEFASNSEGTQTSMETGGKRSLSRKLPDEHEEENHKSSRLLFLIEILQRNGRDTISVTSSADVDNLSSAAKCGSLDAIESLILIQISE